MSDIFYPGQFVLFASLSSDNHIFCRTMSDWIADANKKTCWYQQIVPGIWNDGLCLYICTNPPSLFMTTSSYGNITLLALCERNPTLTGLMVLCEGNPMVDSPCKGPVMSRLDFFGKTSCWTRQHSTQSVGNMPPPSPPHLLPQVLQIMPRNPKYDQFQPKGHHNEENPQSTTKMPGNPKFYPFH